jgi:hypothetical protein
MATTENYTRDKFYSSIEIFATPPRTPQEQDSKLYAKDYEGSESGSSGSSPAMSEQESSKDDLAIKSYVDAYIAVYKEASIYYVEHPNLSQSYNSYILNEQFVQDKRETLKILKKLDQMSDKEPYNKNDDLYKDSPPCLKKLWAATKIVCEKYQGHAEFSRINSHLQKFVLHYHPSAHYSPKEAEQSQMAKTPEKLVLPQAAKEEGNVLQMMGAFFSRSLPSLPSLSTMEDSSNLSRNKSFNSNS